jgi:F-type H+-transporting ATPase subunit delta
MRTSRALAKQVIATYADVLFEAASAEKAVDLVGAELTEAVRTVRGHAQLRDTLVEDVLPAENRVAIAREVFSAMRPVVVSTLAVMIERGDFELLSSVSEAYAAVAEAKRDLVTVDVTTAVSLDDALRGAIKNKLSADLGKDVALREKVDPSIIGGIVIQMHGNRLDASVASQLEAARVTLSNAHTGGDA